VTRKTRIVLFDSLKGYLNIKRTWGLLWNATEKREALNEGKEVLVLVFNSS